MRNKKWGWGGMKNTNANTVTNTTKGALNMFFKFNLPNNPIREVQFPPIY